MRVGNGELLEVTNEDIALDGHFTIPEGVTSIGGWAFGGCTSLTALTIPKGATRIESNAFYGCTSLIALTIPKGVTRIGNGAFNGCTNLITLTIPKGVTGIGVLAFSGCTNLTALTIPKGVTSIEAYAFDGCTSLKYIVVDGNAAELNQIKKLLPLELHSKVISKQRYVAEGNRLLCEATGLPADLVALTQKYTAPLTSGKIKSFVTAEAQEARAAEASQSFKLNCLITTGLCSTLALASLIVALRFPPLALAGGITASVSLGTGLTAFGLYKRSNSSSRDDLDNSEADSPAPSL